MSDDFKNEIKTEFMSEIKDGQDDIKKSVNSVKDKFANMGKLKMLILIVFAIGTALTFVFYNNIFAADGIFAQSPQYSKFVNDLFGIMPRLIKSVQIVTITAVVVTIVLFLVKHFFRKTSRSRTVGGLIRSLIKWVTAIVLVIVVLAVWGVNTTAIIASAGVLTLVVGLGMQSLISDVVAGLFIIFENEFNVGDIITVDGFRGEVISIGIRTTKVEFLGNVKIFNNSQIHGVLNETLKPSVAFSFIGIEYGADLGRVETIIKDNLPSLDVKGALTPVNYDGVYELGSSAVTLRFSTQCKAQILADVQRELNSQLKKMFDANGINIPFNQIVVHNAQEQPATLLAASPAPAENGSAATIAVDAQGADNTASIDSPATAD